eukprot:TRINITY_DN7762_c0_g1_i1.p1 TRINITY_DN7762_c0_g1~~TRINITY_DN7762_c0_g1_i1.p1  ORF type:complete len:110 (-),score=18.46 TRINITY_DN7762_c0_g1_i1:22-351(-)
MAEEAGLYPIKEKKFRNNKVRPGDIFLHQFRGGKDVYVDWWDSKRQEPPWNTKTGSSRSTSRGSGMLETWSSSPQSLQRLVGVTEDWQRLKRWGRPTGRGPGFKKLKHF